MVGMGKECKHCGLPDVLPIVFRFGESVDFFCSDYCFAAYRVPSSYQEYLEEKYGSTASKSE